MCGRSLQLDRGIFRGWKIIRAIFSNAWGCIIETGVRCGRQRVVSVSEVEFMCRISLYGRTGGLISTIKEQEF